MGGVGGTWAPLGGLLVLVWAGGPLLSLSRSWSAPSGLPLLLRKQPIWAAGDTPHLMPVEQGLPWHPVATGLAGQALPCVVAASHAHALPSSAFWFPVPAVLDALVWLPSVVPCPLALLGAPCAHPLLSHPPAPPHEDFTSPHDVDCHGPVATPRCAGHSPRPCGVCRHRVEGLGGLVADGPLGFRHMWWLLRCSLLVVPLSIALCPAGAHVTIVCGATLFPAALLPPPPPRPECFWC